MVALFQGEQPQALRLPPVTQPGLDRFRKRNHVARMSLEDGTALAVLVELLQAKLAHGLQKSVAHQTGRRWELDDQAVVDQRGQLIQHDSAAELADRANGL